MPSPVAGLEDSIIPENEFRALGQSFLMIIASEVGDKTFLIAAILAMRHDRLIVFAGAFGSLVVMSILSAAVGHLLPTLIPRQWTQFAAAVLFLVFGTKMLMEGREMKSGNEKIQEEIKEVEEELEEADARLDGTGGRTEDGQAIPLEAMEAGVTQPKPRSTPSRPVSPPTNGQVSPPRSVKPMQNVVEGMRNCASLFLGPVFVQAFVLTFLGEWGDRSQIATIALAAAHVSLGHFIMGELLSLTSSPKNVYVVTLGTVVGHSVCTAVAVIGGRWLSTKISVKHGKFMDYPLHSLVLKGFFLFQ